MTRDYNLERGFCSLSLEEFGRPLVIYRIDNNGSPVLDNEEILIIKPGGIIIPHDMDKSRKIRIGLKGESYQFLRGKILLKDYNSKKSNLSEEDWNKLKEIV